jgi:hypothetical protein
VERGGIPRCLLQGLQVSPRMIRLMPPMTRFALLSLSVCLTGSALAAPPVAPADMLIAPEVRAQFKLDAFYTKGMTIEGFPVVCSGEVRDEALLEAVWTIKSMLAERSDIFRAMAKNNVRLAIMGINQRTRNIPEHATLPEHWDRRARGVGSTPSRPAVSAAEENLLNLPGDPYKSENILIHEFAHAIHEMGMNTVDPTFDKRLREAYQSALASGLWKATYAASTVGEYWAEGVQAWFDCNSPAGGVHNDINTREKLLAYDPTLAALCKEVFGANPWRYVRADDPSRVGKRHLATLQRDSLPSFKWEPGEKK